MPSQTLGRHARRLARSIPALALALAVSNLSPADGGPLGWACCDSQIAADEFGNVFLVYLTFPVEVALSVDGGATFHPLASLTRPGSVPVQALRRGKLPTGDQPSIAAAEGEVWASWTSFSNGKIQASGAAVTGLGQVGPFSSPQTAQGSNKGDYGDTVIGPDGQVMVTYQNPTGGEGPGRTTERTWPSPSR